MVAIVMDWLPGVWNKVCLRKFAEVPESCEDVGI